MELLKFSVIKFTICLLIGICIAHYNLLPFNLVLLINIALFILLSAFWFILKSKFHRAPYFGILAYICMIAVGYLTYCIKDDTLQESHYTNLSLIKNSQNKITFKIKERLKPDAYNNKYIASIIAIENHTSSGKLLVNIKKDSLQANYKVDDILLAWAEFQDIQKPLNPHQFNYSKYLELNQVYHQLYLKEDRVFQISNTTTSVFGFADKLRTKINSKLIEAGFKDDVLSIINALLLGQKQSINKELYNNYVNSGTIHILAVSGLHVGIIYLILDFIFLHFFRLKNGHFLKPISIVFLLWCFAIIAGLSPSVTRAVTMFSVISFARLFNRSDNIYNTLAVSAFVILLVEPTFLFKVGFQMSYLAVLGIVSIQPKLYKLWKPKYLVTDKFWQILTVTIAAQAGVAPVSLYYFHQFPGLFFISNLIVIPFLGAILGLGIVVILLALLNALPEFIVDFYSIIIESLNDFIAWIATFEAFLLKDIPFTLLQLIIAYVLLTTLIQVYKFKTFKWLAISLVFVIAFQLVLFYNKYSNNNLKFVIFNKSRYSIIGKKYGNTLNLYHNLDAAQLNSAPMIKNFRVGEYISEIKTGNLKSVYQFKKKTILVIDSMAIYKPISFKPDYILLRNSPKLNLARMLDSLKPKTIIADASNYKSYVKCWKITCNNKKIPFHQTSEKGAFIIE